METNKTVQALYCIFVGILLALFLGIGINTFYEAPEAPDYPAELRVPTKNLEEEQILIQKKFDAQEKAWNKKMQPYNRNVSIATLIGAVIFTAVGVAFEKRIKVISNGFIIGGIFSLIYSLGRGFASGDSKYSFAAVTIGLALVLFLGYDRFVRKDETPEKYQEV